MASALFAGIASNWDATITNGVSQTIATEITANAALFASMLTLYIIISGVLTMFGRFSMAEWTFGATRAAIISMLLTATAFSQYIQTPLMTAIPNWIASSVNGSMGAEAAPQQFDALRNSVVAVEASVLQQATGLTAIGERIMAGVATWLICLELTISFIIWEISRGMMGLLVAVAPFVLGLYIFRATRHITLNLASSAISALILLLLMSVLLNISINADQQWLLQANASNGSIAERLDAMMNIGLFFLFGMVMTVFMPILASRIGHSVLPSISGPLTNAASNAIGRARNDIAGAASRMAAATQRIQKTLSK
jgi:type IV secretion system protein VirB6